MLPAQPPFPTPCSLPFHPSTGSHTSTLMSESLDGLSVPVTRHIAGRLANACGMLGIPPGGGGGGLNWPAAMFSAASVACSISSAVSFSHAVLSALWPYAGTARATSMPRLAMTLILVSPSFQIGPLRRGLLNAVQDRRQVHRVVVQPRK